jgi:acetyltransferase-like isoleucine patch superfamily enzyme
MLKKLVSAVAFFLPSWLTRPLYRCVGHRIGRNSQLRIFSYIYADHIELGNDVDIRHFVFVSVRDLRIGSNTIISYGTQIKGEKDFQTGDNCFVGAQTIIHCDESVRFGFYSGVGPRCTINTHGSFLPVTLGYPAVFAEVVLEDFVWTAMGVLFLPGAHVARNCMINPGVVVSGRVPENTRLQMSPEAFKQLDQGKLQRFAQRPAEHYHQAIIKGFLQSRGWAWSEEAGGKQFLLADGTEFRSCPDGSRIELWRNTVKIASYDLETFHTDPSRDRLHRTFLVYIRRRFGLTLRVKY